jgi:hypothetical protein
VQDQQIEGPHAPGERLQIRSAERFTRLLAASSTNVAISVLTGTRSRV